MMLNLTVGQQDSKAVAYSDDVCTPKYFVFNSQVTQTLNATGQESVLISQVGILTKFFTPLLPPDCLRRSHPNLRLRVPPRHPAHVRGAQRVSVHHFWFWLHFLNPNKPLLRGKTKPDVSPKHPSLLLSNSRSRRKMQGVANVSFLAMFIMYLLAALFGYLTFNGMFC